jgi:hypothetical protein
MLLGDVKNREHFVILNVMNILFNLLKFHLCIFSNVQYLRNRIKSILLLCREGRVPVPQEQLPAPDEPLVPVPEIDRLPETHVEIERPPDVPTESQIPVTTPSLEDEQPRPTSLSHPTTTPPLLPPVPHPPPPSRTRTVSVSR